MTILALAGRRKCGKSTAAKCLEDVLLEDFNINVVRLSFADTLKEEFAALNGIGIETLSDPTGKEAFRERLIRFSKEKKAQEGADIFARLTIAKILPLDFVIIDDLRFIEELQALLKVGAIPIKIDADKETRIKRGYIYNPLVDEDYSETEMDLSGQTFMALGGILIYNNKPMPDLQSELTKFLVKEEIVLKYRDKVENFKDKILA